MANLLLQRLRLITPYLTSREQQALLSAQVSLKRKFLLFGLIELYQDSLLVSGWTWTGPVEWQIPLEEVHLVERWTVLKGPNFVFHTEKGALHCRIDGVAWDWEQALKDDARTRLKMRS